MTASTVKVVINTLRSTLVDIIYDNYNQYSDTIYYISMFQFFVYTVWACLKAVTPYNTLKEESTNKNFYDDNYSAPFACRSFAFDLRTSSCLVGALGSGF